MLLALFLAEMVATLDVSGLISRHVALGTLTLHQALFVVFAVVAGLHLLLRLVPAVLLVAGRVNPVQAVPGGSRRVAALGTASVATALGATPVLGASGAWRDDNARSHDFGGPGTTGSPPRTPTVDRGGARGEEPQSTLRKG